MAQTIHIPWYATGLRGDRLQAVLEDVTPTALRYGATAWSLHRSKEDRYKFLQIVHFEDKLDFDGKRAMPYFKCDWNYDLFLSHNLITHLGAEYYD
mgnify:CR=1 FL=1